MAPQRRRSRSTTDERATDERAADEKADDEKAADERQPAEQDKAHAESDGDGRGSIRTARQAAAAALHEILELTAKQPESIVGVERDRDGWSVCFEVVEDRRIPSSADILATYEAKVDPDGELMSLRRIRRYSRGRGDGSGGGK